MTLSEIVEKHGFNRIARKVASQSEPILLIREFNDETYEVEGMQSNVAYTERQDAEGFEYVPSWSSGSRKTSVAMK